MPSKAPGSQLYSAFLRHVLQRVGDHHRLHHVVDDADRELLVGMDGQHAMPDLVALFVVGRRARTATASSARSPPENRAPRPTLPAVSKYWPNLGHCSCAWSLGASSSGRGVGIRHAVVQALPDRHHGLAGEHPVAQQVALRGLAEQLDADLAPGLADQLQHVGLLGAFAGRLDDDLQRPAVGQAPDAVRAALEPDLVEQLVGRLAVVLAPTGSGIPCGTADSRAPPCCCSRWPGRNTAPG